MSAGVEYEYKQVQGYTDKGKVAKLLSKGWEIVESQPVMLGHVTLNQRHFFLRRPKGGV